MGSMGQVYRAKPKGRVCAENFPVLQSEIYSLNLHYRLYVVNRNTVTRILAFYHHSIFLSSNRKREMSHASRTTSVACAPMTLRRPPHARWRWLWAAAADAFFQA